MSHPRFYLAVPNPKSPSGWSTPEGMHFCPDLGDRLVYIDGQPHIEVTVLLPAGGAEDTKPITAIL